MDIINKWHELETSRNKCSVNYDPGHLIGPEAVEPTRMSVSYFCIILSFDKKR